MFSNFCKGVLDGQILRTETCEPTRSDGENGPRKIFLIFISWVGTSDLSVHYIEYFHCISVIHSVHLGTIPKTNEIVKNICSCHNFPPLSSVQIIFIPACCLLCVL